MTSVDPNRRYPKLSFVVLHFGTPTLTLECLESIQRAAQRPNIEIILVDNGSQPDEYALLDRDLAARGVKVDHIIRLDQNMGFSCGMNAGIEVAAGNLVIALNSDTLVGKQLPTLLMRHAVNDDDRIGFYAIPVFNARWTDGRMIPTSGLQAEVTALTWYVSCLPACRHQIASRYILGPPGCAVVMTRRFISHMVATYGFVYDPQFFLYGEDVDLFLRARRQGFRTESVESPFDSEQVIWHVGSANSMIRTLDREASLAACVLSGCLRNVLRHAGTLELLPLLFLQICFRIAFCALYWRRHSWGEVRILALAGIPVRLKRSNWKRKGPFFLAGLIALIYRRPGLWARPWRRGSISELKKRWRQTERHPSMMIDRP